MSSAGNRLRISPIGTLIVGSAGATAAAEGSPRGRFDKMSPGIAGVTAGDGTAPGNKTSHGDAGIGLAIVGGSGLATGGAWGAPMAGGSGFGTTTGAGLPMPGGAGFTMGGVGWLAGGSG